MADAEIPTATTQPQSVTITLSSPITRGDAEISQVTIRKPKAGELRNLKVEELFNTDVNTLFVVLPRITMPTLMENDIAGLETEDLLEFAGAVKGFFMPPAMKAAMVKALGG